MGKCILTRCEWTTFDGNTRRCMWPTCFNRAKRAAVERAQREQWRIQQEAMERSRQEAAARQKEGGNESGAGGKNPKVLQVDTRGDRDAAPEDCRAGRQV